MPATKTGRGRGKVNPPGRGMMNPPGQGPPGGAPMARGRRGSRKGAAMSVGGGAMPGPGGRQLQARVSSGAITMEQAQKTMQQRQTLQKAFGPDWREKMSVGGKSFAEVNKALKANPKDPKLAALRKKLSASRTAALEAARKKNSGGEEE